MAHTSKSRSHESANETHHNMRQATEAARETYERAANTGRRIHEEATSWWRSMMSMADWQRQAESFVQFASDTVPLAQRNMQQFMQLMERNNESVTELMKRAANAFQAPLTGESQQAWMQFWTSSTKAAQTNAEGLMQFGTRAINSWAEFLRKVADVTPESTRAAS